MRKPLMILVSEGTDSLAIRNAAVSVTEELALNGFKVHKIETAPTGSIYIRFSRNYGRGNVYMRIRVADHASERDPHWQVGTDYWYDIRALKPKETFEAYLKKLNLSSRG